jgi:protein-tyrosine phosphatase
MYHFAPASAQERIVFGAARPGYTDVQVNHWIAFMQQQGIQQVCCLLESTQLDRYSDLLGTYRQTFGSDRLCWTPIQDFTLIDSERLIKQILPFFVTAQQCQEKVVVHCSGGVGRTGHVLVAWLVAGRGFSRQAAIAAVRKTGRNPDEAIIAAPFQGRNPWRVAADFTQLLETCQQWIKPLTESEMS